MNLSIEPVQSTLLYGLATGLVALIAGAAALAKLIQRQTLSKEEGLPLFLRITQTKWFIGIQITACLTLLLSFPIWCHLIAALIVSIIIAVGQMIRLGSSEQDCDCFGSMTPRSGAAFLALTLASFVATGYLGVVAAQSEAYRSGFSVYTTAAVIVLLGLIAARLRYDAYATNYFVAKYSSGESPQSLEPSLELGSRRGEPLTVAKALEGKAAVVLIALSATCETCHLLYEDIKAFVQNAGENLSIVIIANNVVVFKGNEPHHLTQLLDKEMKLARYLQVGGTPFAALVNDEYELLAPPSRGRDQVRVLLNLALQLSPA